MNSTILLALVVLTIIAASCLTIFLASDGVILMIQNFGVSRTKFAASVLAAVTIGASLFATWWYASSAREQGQGVSEKAAKPSPQAPHTDMQGGDLNLLVSKLEERLKLEPADAQGLALFARTLMELQRYPAAASAYERAVAALPDDAALHIERADAEYMSHGQKWTQAAIDAIARGLKLAPDYPEALWLAGKERFESKDYLNAVLRWEALERVVTPGSDQARELSTSLAQARAMRDGKDPSKALASAVVSAAPLPSSVDQHRNSSAKDALVAELKTALSAPDSGAATRRAASPQTGVTGVVSLDPALQARVSPDDSVFIFARSAAAGQPGVPLAQMRHRVADLPVRFDLSDNNAVSPEVRLSAATNVIVTARISKSGEARAQPGDLEGISTPIPPGTEKLGVVINRTR